MITFNSVKEKIDSFITYTKLLEISFEKTIRKVGEFNCHSYSFMNQLEKFKFELLLQDDIVHRIEVFKFKNGRIPEDCYKIMSFPDNTQFNNFLDSLLIKIS